MTKACLYQVKTFVQQKPNTKKHLAWWFLLLSRIFYHHMRRQQHHQTNISYVGVFSIIAKKHGNIHCRELLACCAILYNMWSSVWPHPLVHHWLDWRRREFLCVHIHHNIAHNNNNNHERLSLPLFSAKKG